jgi:molybdate transport system substrate-binding protein
MRLTSIVATLLAALSATTPAGAQEIRVLAAGAPRLALNVLGPDFTAATGTRIAFTFGDPVSIDTMVRNAAPCDVIIMPTTALDELSRDGVVKRDTMLVIGTASVGLAVRRGSAVPDISTTAKLRAVLLAATSIAHNDPSAGTTAGISIGRALRQMGIAEQVAPKTKFLRPASVADGEMEMTLAPVAELVGVEGITIAGPLPADLGTAVPYGAALSTNATEPDKALAFLRFLVRPESLPALKAKGFMPVAP